jgi:hypothetical protein
MEQRTQVDLKLFGAHKQKLWLDEEQMIELMKLWRRNEKGFFRHQADGRIVWIDVSTIVALEVGV